ncbi:hypothetical protein THAOC_30098 [Thalassiosira oceanica]|uniref:peptidylprolyl isomerase n=1 Tax=Thalassiosira oceanica TaxID=159749 RepID=K0RC78_THAOC|nr:hypothetical protein THAOC_30098 [Thalassiosira oceanica]|eukprot:EJK50800.1 hypothetical protein THAOC_30098 [Thalassiosira oceanica]
MKALPRIFIAGAALSFSCASSSSAGRGGRREGADGVGGGRRRHRRRALRKSRASPSVHHSDRSDEGVLLGHAVTLEMPVDESSGSAFPEEGDEVHPAEASETRGLFMSMPTRAAVTPTKNPNSSTASSGSEAFPPTISIPTLRPTSLPSADGEGRLIEFTVENLDGEPGKKGTFIVLTRPDWAPIGAERVETLVSDGFFEEVRAFRVLPGFISQFGINGDPEVQAKWRSNYLEDEPVAVSNSRGTISFASAGPGTRTTQLFINMNDRNSFLDKRGFSPIGQVVEGMDVVERFYSGYDDDPGGGPIQWKIRSEGNEYLQLSYPKLSYFSKVQFLYGRSIEFPIATNGLDDRETPRQQEGKKAEVRCTTSKGPIVLTLYEDWSPNGYRKAAELFERGYYDHSHFFGVVPGFLVQFGIGYTADLDLKEFADSTVEDDPKRTDLMPFREGYISFAGSGGKNSRSSQLFFAYNNVKHLGNYPWETPIGEVTEGMEIVRNFYSGYGDMPPWGNGPQKGLIRNEGASYIENKFPLLDKFEICHVKRIDGKPTKNPTKSVTSSGSESFPPTISAPTVRPTSKPVKGSPSASPTLAPNSDRKGRLIEFTVENLDGEPGKKGTFIVLTRPDWAPIGAERVETLVSDGFFEEVRAFRVLPGFISQFGINGDPEVQAKWNSNYIEDEPVAVSNLRGTISFASAGPGTRTTQLFINLNDRNSFLDKRGFSPIGQVVEGMDVVERFYSGYDDDPGGGPIQWMIRSEGNEYLESAYPKLSYFSKVHFK